MRGLRSRIIDERPSSEIPGATGRRRHSKVVVAGTMVTLAVGGCASDEPPSRLDVPAVVWPAGEPAGELEASPWVQIVREAEVLSSVAWNNLDYSDPALIAAWGYETVVDDLYPEAQMRFVPGMYELNPLSASLLDWGPNPLVVLDVRNRGDSGVVTACAVDTRTLDNGDIHTSKVSIYEVRKIADGITEINVNQADSETRKEIGDECSPDVIPEVRFDPQPELPSGPEITLRPPADRNVYEELQAVEE